MTYENICRFNQQLFADLEQCTVMIELLRAKGIDPSYWTNRKLSTWLAIEENLDDMERWWKTSKDVK